MVRASKEARVGLRTDRCALMVWFLRVGIATFLLGTIAFVTASYLPFPLVKDLVEGVARMSGRHFSEGRFGEVCGHLRVASAICLVTAVTLLWYWRKLVGLQKQLVAEWGGYWTSWRNEISSYIHDPWTLWSFLGVFLLGSVFRMIEFFREVRYDEALTYLTYGKQPLYLGLSNYSAPNNHLFHTLLIFLSTTLFGNSLAALRLPALIGGLLMMPAVFAVTSVQYGRNAAVISTALVACSPPFISYSVNARGYTWQVAFLLLMAWCACRIDRQRRPLLNWVGLVLAGAGAVYTIPTSVVPCGGVIVWLMLILRRNCQSNKVTEIAGQMTPVILSMVILVMVLYLPPVIFSGPSLIFENRFVQPMGMTNFLHNVPQFAKLTWLRWTDGLPLLAQVGIVMGFVLGLTAPRKSGRDVIPLTLFVILSALTFSLTRTTLGFSRVWLHLWAFILVTTGAGIALVLSRRSFVAVFAVAFTAAVGIAVHRQGVVYWSTETGYTPQLIEAAAWMDQHLNVDDRIVSSMLCGAPLSYLVHRKFPRLEPQILPGTAPKRIVAVIAKQPIEDYGPVSRDARSWRLLEVDPSTIMFERHDRLKYSHPRLVKDLIGVTIWEARKLP